MQVLIRPSAASHQEVDITQALIGTIAAELHRIQGGNDVLNWLEAERFLQSIVRGGAADSAASVTEGEREAKPQPKALNKHDKPQHPAVPARAPDDDEHDAFFGRAMRSSIRQRIPGRVF